MKDRETLKNLIQNSKLEEKELKNILFKTLQKTNDIIRVKSLMTEVLDGNLDNISDKDIKSLITVLDGTIISKENFEVTNELKQLENSKNLNNEDRILRDAYNTTMYENQKLIEQLRKAEEEIKQLKKQLDSQEVAAQRLKQLESKLLKFESFNIEKIIEENKKLKKMLLLTEKQDIIEVLDEDINNLYMQYLSEGVEQFGKAIICRSKDKVIIPKTYYELREVK